MNAALADGIRALPRVDKLASVDRPEPVLDCRGVEISEGRKVVTAGGSNRLFERTVKRIESRKTDGMPRAVPFVWMTDGSYTTPDRVAVVEDSRP